MPSAAEARVCPAMRRLCTEVFEAAAGAPRGCNKGAGARQQQRRWPQQRHRHQQLPQRLAHGQSDLHRRWRRWLLGQLRYG